MTVKDLPQCVLCDSRRGLGHVPHTEERVVGVRRAQDARREHDGQRAGRHLVVLLLLGDPADTHKHCLDESRQTTVSTDVRLT